MIDTILAYSDNPSYDNTWIVEAGVEFFANTCQYPLVAAIDEQLYVVPPYSIAEIREEKGIRLPYIVAGGKHHED